MTFHSCEGYGRHEFKTSIYPCPFSQIAVVAADRRCVEGGGGGESGGTRGGRNGGWWDGVSVSKYIFNSDPVRLWLHSTVNTWSHSLNIYRSVFEQLLNEKYRPCCQRQICAGSTSLYVNGISMEVDSLDLFQVVSLSLTLSLCLTDERAFLYFNAQR